MKNSLLGNLTGFEIITVEPGTQITLPDQPSLTVTDTNAVFCGRTIYATKEQVFAMQKKIGEKG